MTKEIACAKPTIRGCSNAPSLTLFHVAFAQFTLLQISKSLKAIDGGELVSVVFVTALCGLLIGGVTVYRDRFHPLSPLCIYVSFVTLSLLDGALSNHVVTSNALALIVLSCFSTIASKWQSQLRTSLCWFTSILYLVTGIHKLNDGFFDQHHSCARLYVSGALSVVPPGLWQFETLFKVAQFFIWIAPYGAVTVELGLPCALLLSLYMRDPLKLLVRRISLLIGASFHLALAFSPSPLSAYPFSAIMVPLYVLLVPTECALAETVSNLTKKWWTKAGLCAVLVVAHKHATAVLFNEPGHLFEYPNYGMWSISLVWNVTWWSVIIYALLRRSGNGTESDHSINSSNNHTPGGITKLLLLLVFLFALTPYIGLRNYPALAMFSNMRTEGKNPNHWNYELDLFEYQKDYVIVTNSNLPAIANLQINLGDLFPQQLKSTNDLFGISNEFYICPPRWYHGATDTSKFREFAVPFIELRRRIAHLDWDALKATHQGEFFIEYTRHMPNGTMHNHTFTSNDISNPKNNDILKKLNMFEKYFTKFRSFSDQYSPCRH